MMLLTAKTHQYAILTSQGCFKRRYRLEWKKSTECNNTNITQNRRYFIKLKGKILLFNMIKFEIQKHYKIFNMEVFLLD